MAPVAPLLRGGGETGILTKARSIFLEHVVSGEEHGRDRHDGEPAVRNRSVIDVEQGLGHVEPGVEHDQHAGEHVQPAAGHVEPVRDEAEPGPDRHEQACDRDEPSPDHVKPSRDRC